MTKATRWLAAAGFAAWAIPASRAPASGSAGGTAVVARAAAAVACTLPGRIRVTSGSFRDDGPLAWLVGSKRCTGSCLGAGY